MDEDWQRIDPHDETWIQEQIDLVLDGTLRQLRDQMPPCEVSDAMRRFGPRIRDSIELHVRRQASKLANAMRESESANEVRH